MRLQPPLEASAALSAPATAPGLPNPFPEVREPHARHVASVCFVSPEAMASAWKYHPLSHPRTTPAAHPSVDTRIHDPGISATAALPRGSESLSCVPVYDEGRCE